MEHPTTTSPSLPPIPPPPSLDVGCSTLDVRRSARSAAALLWALAGIALAFIAWTLPVHLKSITPELLAEAARGTLTPTALGQRQLDADLPGPAALALATARSIRKDDPLADALQLDLFAYSRRHPELIPWGGRDPFLAPLLKQPALTPPSPPPGKPAAEPTGTPILTHLITDRARTALRDYLSNSRSPGVLTLLQTREIKTTAHFVPATQTGGQTLDATLLLAALLYQGEHLAPPLQQQLRNLAATAISTGQMGDLETVYLNLLSLGRRLDWMQLTTLLRLTGTTETLAQFAGLARAYPDTIPLLHTAALFEGSADPVAAYLQKHGYANALPDLTLALGLGQGAVQQLLLRQVPVTRQTTLDIGPLTRLAHLHPHLTLIAKYLAWFLAAFCLLRALDRAIVGRARSSDPSEISNLKSQIGGAAALTARSGRPHLVSAILAILLAALVIAATEPFLLRATPPATDFKLTFAVPVIADLTNPATLTQQAPTFAMDINSLLSIGLFAALQIGMYLICLLKIQGIDRLPLGPLVKLRLMENEENLFDGGLYLGIAGTAAALVLQVLGVIEPNLLAAYSSNLFGITCVALVKIRHVRPYKNKLILEGQAAITAAAATAKP
ncbi:hypothetical protein [Geminisphaera colitermitum]|uniref:hypothetical protein n=1 Tax=Geminisphaera colitermitum TaxID=1148786 RepID=UPI0009DCCEDE|nr:hypothetical protein [Geminisphaera colitermitum]